MASLHSPIPMRAKTRRFSRASFSACKRLDVPLRVRLRALVSPRASFREGTRLGAPGPGGCYNDRFEAPLKSETPR
jgi:hypothetical protein